jgi:hypothetical protein
MHWDTEFDSQTEDHSPIAQRQSRELLTLRFLVRIEVGELKGLETFGSFKFRSNPAVLPRALTSICPCSSVVEQWFCKP